MAVKSDAYIVYHNGKYLIRPAFAAVSVAGNNPKFRIRNMTDFADAEVVLPSSRIKPGKENKKAARALRGQDLAEFDLAKLDGCFTYQVTIAGQPVVGESDPVIIIDPPAN